LKQTANDLWTSAAPLAVAYELKILQVTQDCSRSFEITPIGRACVTSY